MLNTHIPQTIYITGATSGFGEAMARLFAERLPTCKLILTGRRRDRLESLADSLNVDTLIIEQDITNVDAVKADFDSLPPAFRAIDLLINNAGLALGAEKFHEMPFDDAMRMIDTNNRGLIATTHLILKGMVERHNGHIINIGSVAGTYPYPGANVYGATKAFVNHFSIALRADLKGQNVRVSSVEPGSVETEFSLVRFKGDQNKADNVYTNHRSLNASHIAETIYWMATCPPEMNVNRIEIMPTDQSFNGFSFDRG